MLSVDATSNVIDARYEVAQSCSLCFCIDRAVSAKVDR